METYIHFTATLFAEFKKEYERHAAFGREQFVFEGHTFVTSYAKYLIEYLEPQFKE